MPKFVRSWAATSCGSRTPFSKQPDQPVSPHPARQLLEIVSLRFVVSRFRSLQTSEPINVAYATFIGHGRSLSRNVSTNAGAPLKALKPAAGVNGRTGFPRVFSHGSSGPFLGCLDPLCAQVLPATTRSEGLGFPGGTDSDSTPAPWPIRDRSSATRVRAASRTPWLPTR